MTSSPRTTIGVLDIASRLPAMIGEVPALLRGVPGFLRKPDDRESIGQLFQRVAAKVPDRDFIRFEGNSITYRDANQQVNRYASVLAARGVQRGDVVGILAKNSPGALLVALATVKLGAAAGMLNYNQRGDVLKHSLGILDSRVVVVGEDCLDALDSLDEALPEKVVLQLGRLDSEAASAPTANPSVTAQIQAKEMAFYIFTSGTTGMPKASLMSHFRWLKSMSGLGSMGVRLRKTDVLYCCLPLYHNNALTVSLSSVLAGSATFAIGKQFSVSKFWDDIRLNRATGFTYIGELCRYLLNQPPSGRDRENDVRLMVGNGLRPEIWHEFTERFGIERVAEFYGASECNIAFINALNVDRTAGLCPLPYSIVEYDEDTGRAKRHADGRLRKVERGGVGLLLSKVTDRAPFDGYTDPEASNKKLIKDGFADGDMWFDTGDLVRKQGFMHVAFVDRLGDTFRWKGENVATTQVEGAIGTHDSVAQAVVYGVAIPGADGKAGMAAVTLLDGESFDGVALAEVAYAALPTYAVPLFVRVVDSLEATSTFKSKKVELRADGYDPSAGGDLYVLAGRADGYVPFYDGYAAEVAGGKRPKG